MKQLAHLFGAFCILLAVTGSPADDVLESVEPRLVASAMRIARLEHQVELLRAEYREALNPDPFPKFVYRPPLRLENGRCICGHNIF